MREPHVAHKTRRALVASVLGLAALILAAGPAGAHALPQSSDPAAGATLSTPPAQVSITFGEEPDVHLSSLRVLDSTGQNHTVGLTEAVRGQPLTLRVAVGPLGKGVYTVAWRTVSKVDGHLATGTFAFGVGVTPTATLGSGGLTSKSPDPSTQSVVSRWLLYVGVMLLVGAALITLVGHDELPPRLAALLALGCGLGVLGAAGIAWDAARAAHLGVSHLPGSSIGRQFLARAVPTIVAGVAAVAAFRLPLRRKARRVMVAVVGVAGLAAMWGDVAASHASAARSWRYARMAVQWAHFASAGVWVGGLVALVATIGDSPDRTRLARRFSAIALGSVVVLAASGAQRAYDEIGSIHRLVTTGFGQDVIVKSTLLGVMVTLGALNRYRSVPAIVRTLRPLRTVVRGEVGVAVAVLAVTGVLQGLAPPTSVPSPPKPLVLNATDFATTVRVTLSITPAMVGFNRFTVHAVDYDTGAPSGTDASLRFALAARPDLGASTLPLTRSRPGMYAGDGANLSIDGTWTITVAIQRVTGGVEVPFQVTTRTPPERIVVERNAGLPDVYTLQLPQQQTLQVYLDPGHGGFNEFHLTFIGANGQEIPMTTATVTATPGGALTVRRLDPIGHFVADLPGATRRAYRFQVIGTTGTGASLPGAFTITVR